MGRGLYHCIVPSGLEGESGSEGLTKGILTDCIRIEGASVVGLLLVLLGVLGLIIFLRGDKSLVLTGRASLDIQLVLLVCILQCKSFVRVR